MTDQPVNVATSPTPAALATPSTSVPSSPSSPATDAEATTPASSVPDRQRISSGSPYEQPIGFSRAIRVGDRVLVAGTAPVWPDGSVDPDPHTQAARCLEIIVAALGQAGATAADVVRTRIYLTDPSVWEAIGRAHGEIFGDIRPASTMVVVKALLDPRWFVEIEAEAVISGAAAG